MFNFFKSDKTKKTIQTREVISNLDNLDRDIRSSLQMILVGMEETEFKSKFYAANTKWLRDELKRLGIKVRGIDHDTDVIDFYLIVTEHLLRTIPWLQEQFKTRQIETEGMDMKQLNLLQMVELLEFMADYMLNASCIITQYELVEAANHGTIANISGLGIPKLEDKFTNNRYAFLLAASVFLRDHNEIVKAYGRVPALIAEPESYYELQQSIGKTNVDPLNLSAPPFPLSIIFYAQLTFADWQMSRLEKAETTAKAIRYRIALLRRQNEGLGPDAALESQMAAYEARLKQIHRKIDKMEKSYGLTGA